MNQQFTFTIITVTADAERNIRQKLDSVLEQGSRDYTIEYIVVDRGSTDYTLEILHEYQNKFAAANIEYSINKENELSLNEIYDKYLSVANGQWISILDNDCWYQEDTINKIFANLDDVDIIHGWVRYINAECNLSEDIILSIETLKQYGIVYSSMFIRKDTYDIIKKDKIKNTRFLDDPEFALNLYNSFVNNKISLKILDKIFISVRTEKIFYRKYLELQILYFLYKNSKFNQKTLYLIKLFKILSRKAIFYGIKVSKKIIKLNYYIIELLFGKTLQLFAKKSDLGIVRVDSIGDYIIFRNFLETLKNSGKFKDITLIGNIAWKEIAENFDDRFVDKFIWIDKNKMEADVPFIYKIKYRLWLLSQISKYQFKTLIHPTYAREYMIGESIVRKISAKNKIAPYGDCSWISIKDKKKANSFYDLLIPSQAEVKFEYFRNLEFFQSFLTQDLKLNYNLRAIKTKYHDRLSNYVVLFVGASRDFRRWRFENFLDLATRIHNSYGYKIILCGDKNNKIEIVNKNIKLPPFIENMVGETTMLELIDILSQSKFVVSNETSVPHICVALDIKIFVISNGNHFGRFTPYPHEITNKYFPIYHPEIMKDMDSYDKLVLKYGYGHSTLDINAISVDQVWQNLMPHTMEL